METETTYKLRPDLIIKKDLEGGPIVYDNDIGVLYRFNRIGQEIIELICKGIDLQQAVHKIAETYPGATKNEITQIFNDFMAQLEKYGIIDTLEDKNRKITLLAWDITYKCNLKCKHCYLGRIKPRDELGKKVPIKILESFQSAKPRFIEFSGGEPFIRKDFMEILTATSEKNYCVFIRSNGTLISKDISKTLSDLGNVQLVNVSLDGPNEKINSLIRDHGGFKRTIAGIKNLVTRGVKTKVVYTAHEGNYDHIEETIRLCIDLGVQAFFISSVFEQGCAPKYKITLSPKRRLDHFMAVAALAEKYKAKIVIPSLAERLNLYLQCNIKKEGCGLTRRHITINPYGEVFACRRFFNNSEFRLGRLPEDNLEKILESHKIKALRERKVDNLPGCASCSIRYVCGGLCRQNAYANSNNIKGKDPDCKAYKKALLKFIDHQNKKSGICTDSLPLN